MADAVSMTMGREEMAPPLSAVARPDEFAPLATLAPAVAIAPHASPSPPYGSRDVLGGLPSPHVAAPVLESARTVADRLALFDALPVAVILIDRTAIIHFANTRVTEVLELDRDEMCGRSVLDFVLLDDVSFAADLLASTFDERSDRIMGPIRMRYVDASGIARWTQVWANEAPEELGCEGFLLTLTRESVRDVLVSAVGSLASDDELDLTLSAVALSARAMPLNGTGAILTVRATAVDDDLRFRQVGHWPIDTAMVNACGTPWRDALSSGCDADVDDVAASAIPSGVRAALLAAGVKALFVRLICDVGNEIVGVYVVFRNDVGAVFVNQDDHLRDGVRLASLAIAQTRRRAELEDVARTDPLTGIANRTAFNERLETERRHADVLFIDLDHFKSVNDTFGHHVGDLVVAEAADRIQMAIRHIDTAYRTGGDEFVVVCEPTGDDPVHRIALAERIIERLTTPFDVGGHRVCIGATVGVAQAVESGLSATVRAADKALYAAKQLGRAGWSQSA